MREEHFMGFAALLCHKLRIGRPILGDRAQHIVKSIGTVEERDAQCGSGKGRKPVGAQSIQGGGIECHASKR
jgi:hypothetical protein